MGDRGRPTDYSPELAADICEALVNGSSLRAICRSESMPSISAVMRWIGEHEVFREQYARATAERAAGVFEDIFDIGDEVEVEAAAIAKARLRIDTRKWALARMDPKKYGDKIQQEHSGDMSFTVVTGVPRAGG